MEHAANLRHHFPRKPRESLWKLCILWKIKASIIKTRAKDNSTFLDQIKSPNLIFGIKTVFQYVFVDIKQVFTFLRYD